MAEDRLKAEEITPFRQKLLEATRDDKDIPGWNQRLAAWAVDNLGIKPEAIVIGRTAEVTAQHLLYYVQSHQIAEKLREALK